MPEENIDRGDDFVPTPDVENTDPAPADPPADPPAEEAEADTPPVAAEAADDEEAGDEEAKEEHRIPKARFDEAVKRERDRAATLEAQLKGFQDREAQRSTAANLEESMAKVKELTKSHTSLLADGELDKAADVMEQMLQLHADMSDARLQAASQSTRTSVKEEMRYDAVVTAIEATYPMINPDSDDFDTDITRRVQSMMAGIMQTERKDPATALQEAADILLSPLVKKETKSLREEPTPAAVDSGMRRKSDAVAKAVKASEQQPASTADVGKDHDKEGGALDASSVMKMSWEEFVKLPESTLSNLRGDHI